MKNFDDHTAKMFDEKTGQFLFGGAARNRTIEQEGGLKQIKEKAYLEGFNDGFKEGHQVGLEEGIQRAIAVFSKEIDRKHAMLIEEIKCIVNPKVENS